MMSVIAPVYGALSYVCFFLSFLYAVGFIHNLAVPRSVDVGPVAEPALAVAIDLALLSLFAIQHSVMARQGFKRWWTRIVPKPMERSNSSELLAILSNAGIARACAYLTLAVQENASIAVTARY